MGNVLEIALLYMEDVWQDAINLDGKNRRTRHYRRPREHLLCLAG
jgi:hypothetical protein